MMTHTNDTPTDKITNYWQEFKITLKERLVKPCNHPTFVMYFFVIIVVIGGLGLLEPIVSCFVLETLPLADFPKTLVSATYTYFVAIAATAAVDLILSYHKKKYLLMFFLLGLIIVFFCFLFAVTYSTFLKRPLDAGYPAVLGYVMALFLWWIGNANNAKLLDADVNPNAAIGDDKQPIGNLTGYNT